MSQRQSNYRPPSKRRLQVEAWGVLLTAIIVGWCFIGGTWMGLKLLWALLSW